MQKELQEKINLLIEMAGSQTSYEVLLEELQDLEQDISSKKNQVKSLKKSMKDEKYIKDNERIIDENIKVGLENKKQQFQIELEEAEKNLKKAALDEEDTHHALVTVTNRLKSLNSLLETLRLKLRAVHQNESLNAFYETMIETITNEITETEKKKDILSGNYEKVQERLEHFGNQVASFEQKLESISSKLEDTLQALTNPNSYVDGYLKKQDLEKVDHLNEELEALEKEKEMILDNPVYLGHEACQLLEEDDKTGALAYLKKLVTYIQSKPYMMADAESLNELLEQATSVRDEFVNVIENNAYIGEDFGVIDARIDYLQTQIASYHADETYWKKKMQQIDENQVVQLLTALDTVKALYDKAKEEYETYKQVVFGEDDTKSPRKRAGLQAAYRRKKEELDSIGDIVGAYQTELEQAIEQSRLIEQTILTDLQKKIRELELAIQELKKKKTDYTHAKDVLAVEKDRKTLKKLSDDVDAIRHRLEYSKSATQLYDEIEVALCSGDEKEEGPSLVAEELTKQVGDYVDLNDFRIQDFEDVQESSDISSFFSEKEDSSEVSQNEEEMRFEESKLEAEDSLVFPPRNSVNSMPNRFKVVQVEPLRFDEKKEEEKSEEQENPVESLDDEFTILGQSITQEPSLEETNEEEEYISFNELLNGGTTDEN